MNFLILSIFVLLSTTKLQNSYAEDLILGFFDGLGKEVDLSLIKDCAQNIDPVVEQVTELLDDIQHIDVKNLFPLVAKLYMIATTVYGEIQPCISGSDELVELFNKIMNVDIENRMTFIITHSFQLIAIIMDIQKQADSGSAYKVGKDIGSIVFIVAIGNSVADVNDPVYFFLSGFFLAFNKTITNTQIMACLTNGNTLWVDALATFEIIKKTNWKSVSAVFATLIAIEKLVKEIIVDLQGCKSSIPELDALLKSIEKINITELVPDVIMNFGRIQTDISKIQISYSGSNWTGVGYYLGDIFVVFIPAQTTQLKVATPLAFVTGLLEGLQVSVDVSNLISCLQNAEGIIDDIKDAMSKLKKIDFSHILTIVEGLKELVSSVEDLLNKITPCVNSPQDLQNIITKLSNINWSGVPKKVLSNLPEIIEDAAEINSGFNDGDYEVAGEGVGDLIRVVLL